MKHDMISIFNRLTESELADCELFYNILKYHYEKYKFFYWSICDVPFDTVQRIQCSETPDALFIIIKFDNDEDRDSFEEIMEDDMKNFHSDNEKYFIMNIETAENRLNISIENKIYREEEKIYEDRFDSC